MARIVFFSIPTRGHINPTLPVAKELAKRGNEVLYYATKEYKNLIDSFGCIYKEYPHVLDFDLRISKNTVLVTQKALEITKANIVLTKKEIEKLKPDLIIHDAISLWGKTVAAQLNIPAVSCITTFIINKKVVLKYFKAFSLSLYLMFRHGRTTLKIVKSYNSFAKENGLKTTGVEDVFINREKLNIVFTSKFFQPFGNNFDDSFKFVGPSLYDRKDGELTINRSKKIIYISLGTIFNDDFLFYKTCIELFKNTNYQIVLSIGHRFKKNDLKEIPDNFIIENYIPQLEVLKKSSLFISHGGMNSVNESLYFGVPMIIIPQTDEQKLNGMRVKELGAGLMFGKSKISKKLLSDCVEKIFNNKSFYDNAEKIGASLKNAYGYKKAAELIDSYMQTKMV